MKRCLYLLFIALGCLLNTAHSLQAEQVAEISQHDFYREEGLVYHEQSGKLFSGYIVYRYEEGQVESRKPYVNGILHGICEYWYESGQKKQELTYSQGELSGSAVGWHENGVTAFEGQYLNGKQDGLWRQWDANGQLIAERSHSAKPAGRFVLSMPKPPGS